MAVKGLVVHMLVTLVELAVTLWFVRQLLERLTAEAAYILYALDLYMR